MATDIVGSKEPTFASDAGKKPVDNTKTGFGQNGYMGASSDTDLSNPTRSAMAVELFPNVDLKAGIAEVNQTRTVAPGNVPLAFGMKERSSRNT